MPMRDRSRASWELPMLWFRKPEKTVPIRPPLSPDDVLLQFGIQHVAENLQRADALDAKAMGMLAIGSTTLPITLAILGVASLGQPSVWDCALYVLSVLAYVALVGASTRVFRLQTFGSYPQYEQLLQDLLNKPLLPPQARDELFRTLQCAIQANRQTLQSKTRWAEATLWALCAEILFILLIVLKVFVVSQRP